MKPDNSVLDKDTKLKFPHVLVIDASAGSGKTHTLAQRFVQFLLSPRVRNNDLANILAITFTNNAAREMKQRIIKWLKVLALGLDMKGEDREQIHHLLEQKPEAIRQRARDMVDAVISRYSDFHVQTIDSFMNRILRGSADELNMPPENEVTESYGELTRQAMNELFAGIGTTIPYAEVESFLDLFNYYQGSFKWNPAENIRKEFMGFLGREGKDLEEFDFRDVAGDLRAKFNELHGLYGDIRNKFPKVKMKDGVTGGLTSGDYNDFDAKAFFGSFKENLGIYATSIKHLTEDKTGAQLLARWQACGIELTDLYSRSKYTAFGPLYRRFKDALESVKRWTETIHFDDINKKLSTYLKREVVPEMYCRLGDVLYHFLLDEFQDTARVQWQNIQPLLDEAYSKNGTLFVVGDMKQAIFMWRKADYRIMRKLVRCIKGELGPGCLNPSVGDNAWVIPLAFNYRSGGRILEYVDSVFKQRLKNADPVILSEDRTGLTDYCQQVPEDKAKAGYVRNIVISKTEGEPEMEAMVGIVKDVMKRYPLRDIAVLAYENERIETVVSWLTAAGIRAASLSSLNIRKRKVIMEIVNLLQFLDTPIDNLSFTAFITGDVFLAAARKAGQEVDREAMLDMVMEWKQSKKTPYLYIYFRDHSQYQGLWTILFKRLYEIVGFYPLYDLVAEVYKTFAVMDNFPDETGFLVRFLEAITAMESQGMADIKDLVDLVTQEETESVLDILLPDYMDAVKAMTFHKAKGLGFPVVINLFYPSSDDPGYVLFDQVDNRLLMRYAVKAMRLSCPRLSEVYEETKLDNRIQNLNVMYVALTRAKNELYNIVTYRAEPEEENGEAAAAEPATEKPAAKGKVEKPKPEPKPKKGKEPAVVDLIEEFECGTKEKPKAAKSYPEPTPVVIPGKSLADFTRHERDEDKHWTMERRLETEIGNLFHQVLAGIEYLPADPGPMIAGLVKDALALSGTTADPEGIKATLLEFLAEPTVRTWFEKKPGREILREAEFVNEAGALSRMDRVIVDPDRIMLVDFKTGAKLSFYQKQIDDYRRILKAVYPDKPIACYWAYVDKAKVEEVS